jgi:hypothetical protein
MGTADVWVSEAAARNPEHSACRITDVGGSDNPWGGPGCLDTFACDGGAAFRTLQGFASKLMA